jgi:hypothetical protein
MVTVAPPIAGSSASVIIVRQLAALAPYAATVRSKGRSFATMAIDTHLTVVNSTAVRLSQATRVLSPEPLANCVVTVEKKRQKPATTAIPLAAMVARRTVSPSKQDSFARSLALRVTPAATAPSKVHSRVNMKPATTATRTQVTDVRRPVKSRRIRSGNVLFPDNPAWLAVTAPSKPEKKSKKNVTTVTRKLEMGVRKRASANPAQRARHKAEPASCAATASSLPLRERIAMTATVSIAMAVLHRAKSRPLTDGPAKSPVNRATSVATVFSKLRPKLAMTVT